MTPFFLSQIFIGFAICCDSLSFQFKERKKILSVLVISCVLIGSHFALLEQWTAAGLAGLSSLRFLVSVKTTSKKTMWIFITLSCLMAAVTYDGYLSILTGLGAVFSTAGSFSKNDKHLRMFMLVGTGFWLTNNILIGSPAAVAMEGLFIGSNLLGYYRFYIEPSLENRK